ncbi:MAG TPA: cytochrome c oxidase assembly factor Coa1 family protein [Pyrinomonadaceae bacterium]|nr:cytochrome c oxidase assembly factor Coa1 family protein [Pyrinomonadaceae bacterium]
MTTKKIVIIVGAIVLVLGLIVVIVAGGIIGIVFYSIGTSEAAQTAKTFLKANERLKNDIGEVKDFGSLVTGSVNVENSSGKATINLKVIGERQTVNASVELIYRNGQPWRVTAATYQNDNGETIELLNPFQGRILLPKLFLKVAA